MNLSLPLIAILCGILNLSISQVQELRDNQVQIMRHFSKLLHKLSKLNKFDNLIVYRTRRARPQHNSIMTLPHKSRYSATLDEPAMFNPFIATDCLMPRMSFTVDTRIVNDTRLVPNLGHILTNNNLAAVKLGGEFNLKIMNFVATSLGASIETKIVFLYLGDDLSDMGLEYRMKKLRFFFRWCWSKNMLDVVLTFKLYLSNSSAHYVMEVYTYTPFPQPIQLVRLTAEHVSKYFVQKTGDLMGYKFKTPVMERRPSVFKMLDPKTGKEVITGTAGLLYVEFVSKMNATFTEVPSEDAAHYRSSFDFTLALLKKREIDIGIHPYTFLMPYEGHGSFPITNTNSCIVVPVVPEIFRGYYIPYTFNIIIWKYLLLTFLLFFALHIAYNYRRNGRWQPHIAFAITLNGMMNLPSSYTLQPCPYSGYKLHFGYIVACTRILLMCTGLIFTHLHVATLTSLLSTTMYGKQLRSLEDLRAANVSVMLLHEMSEVYRYVDVLPESFKDNLIISDEQTIARHQGMLDTKYAYVVYQEEWKVMRRLQMNLWKPLFKVAPKLCIPNMYLTFPMQFNSPFNKRLKRFILRTKASGLETKWSDMVYSQIQKQWRSFSVVERRDHPVPITMEHLMVVWYIWGVGMALAITVFCVEQMSCSKKRN